jgi:hypothetical protein
MAGNLEQRTHSVCLESLGRCHSRQGSGVVKNYLRQKTRSQATLTGQGMVRGVLKCDNAGVREIKTSTSPCCLHDC